MTDYLLELVADWGVWALAVTTFLSCLALPVPSSMMMLASGAFVASGDLAPNSVIVAALVGAVLGDQVGYGAGRAGFSAAESWLMRNPLRASVLTRAQDTMQRRGAAAVFLSRWLFSVLGPYVNLIAGGARMNWATFTLMGIAGEMVWVAVYIGLGYAAGGQLAMVTEMLGNATGLATSALVTLGLGWVIWRRRHAGRSDQS